MIRRILAVAIGLLAVVCGMTILQIALGFIQERTHMSVDDWITILLPLVGLVVVMISAATHLRRPAKGLVLRSVEEGIFIASALFTLLLATITFAHRATIAADGTAYWGMLAMPTFWTGIPLLILGIVIGLIIGLVLKSLQKRKRPQPAGGAYFLPGADKKSAHP